MKQNPTRGTGPGSRAIRRRAGLTPLQQIQWGGHSDVDKRYQLTQQEKDALKRTGYYSTHKDRT